MLPLEAVRQLILGSIHGNAGNVDEAKLSYGRAIKQEAAVLDELAESAGGSGGQAGNEVHAAAFAAYELGLLLCRVPEVSQ